jgi:uncharacterized protein with HEPN domain
MIRDVRLYLDDILESINLINQYLEGVTEEQFHKSKEKQDSVVRRIEIIGEATKSIANEFKEQNPHIPWQKMAGMRNILIHEYFGINWVTVWKTATQFIPPLKKDIQSLISSE